MKDAGLTFSIGLLLILSGIVLKSIAPSVFPLQFVYLGVAIGAFWFFSQIDFDIISLFSKHLYIISIILLIITLIIGQKEKVDFKRLFTAILLLTLPVFLILIQPSLGVSALTVVGFCGVLISSNFNKKYILAGLATVLILIPVFWQVMAPYQRQRISTFINPSVDPLGAGYNSLQSTIAAGAGKITGRGLGRGVQTQLAFLPEKQTDFIFAAVSEEMGFVGAGIMLAATFVILFRLVAIVENSISPAARAYVSGFFLIYLLQVFIHVGMNLGMLPVTGLPFPLVSAGGSSLLATMIGLGIALGAYKR
ncbi:MAG: Rod shape-determining protein RodA [Candidatus Woesebacteria bacterium GW2011_GWA2_40_7b]|uniref:Probable peptidoglycan glycosyltransferase FtsW n=1 Tax=Candidatus Woesebacteria bacterium GW2011_GWA2_40_7b TaxID=1618563 RepID=A0A0G0T4D2_9BACT|nr:MAG: Rod shape-determining protein RodA [Candidatus Woesebacteria bacterium GW2011_GWA2_40_7b]